MNKEEVIKRLKDYHIISPAHQYNSHDLDKLCGLIQDDGDWNLYYYVWYNHKVFNLSYILHKFEDELNLKENSVVAYCLGIPIKIQLDDGMTRDEFYRMCL